MSYKLDICASLANRVFIRYQSTLALANNVINCGINMAQHKVQSVIHGATCDEITKDMDLADKTCLITGANSGIGLEMTRCLSARGATVLMACRNKYAADITTRSTCRNTHLLQLYEVNLASLRSVRKCYNEILKDQKKIDVVVLNAGVFGLPWTLTEDMLETTFQVNYLSQFYLLMNIESILAPNARVVFVSSESHRNINFSHRDLMIPCEETVSLPSHDYTSIKAYNISKLCSLLAMRYLGYRWMKCTKRVFSAHPGSFVKTRLCRNWWPYEVLYTAMVPFTKNVRQAASTPLYCAVSPAIEGLSNIYFKDCKPCEESDLAKDFHLAFRINDLTRDLIQGRDILAIDDGKAAERISSSQPDKETVHHTLTPELSA